MNILRIIASATAVTAMASASFAGGLSDQIMEAPVVVEEEVVAAGPSVDPSLIVLGVLALLILGASSGGDDDSDYTVPDNEEPLDVITAE